jgi:hypothetical protein
MQEFQARVLAVVRAHAVDSGGTSSPVADCGRGTGRLSGSGSETGEGAKGMRSGIGYMYRHRQRGINVGTAMVECRFDCDEVGSHKLWVFQSGLGSGHAIFFSGKKAFFSKALKEFPNVHLLKKNKASPEL